VNGCAPNVGLRLPPVGMSKSWALTGPPSAAAIANAAATAQWPERLINKLSTLVPRHRSGRTRGAAASFHG